MLANYIVVERRHFTFCTRSEIKNRLHKNWRFFVWLSRLFAVCGGCQVFNKKKKKTRSIYTRMQAEIMYTPPPPACVETFLSAMGGFFLRFFPF